MFTVGLKILFVFAKLAILCIFMITEVLLSEPNSSSFSEVMLKGLNRLPWERVDVSFKKSRQRFFAHSTIQVCVFLLLILHVTFFLYLYSSLMDALVNIPFLMN